MKKPDLKPEPGWMGAFTRAQADHPDTIPNGTKIVKSWSEPGDGTPVGTKGTVLGSIFVPEVADMIMYFVEWDSRPRLAVGVVQKKIARAS